MKILIRVGFLVWKFNHCGSRHIVDSRRDKVRRLVAFHVAMTIRYLVINWRLKWKFY